MKRSFLKKTAIALSLLTVLGLFTACGEEETAPKIVEPEVLMPVVTIEADGKQITIEDTEGNHFPANTHEIFYTRSIAGLSLEDYVNKTVEVGYNEETGHVVVIG